MPDLSFLDYLPVEDKDDWDSAAADCPGIGKGPVVGARKKLKKELLKDRINQC